MLKSTRSLTWLKKGVVLAYFLGGCSILATQQEMMEDATVLTQEVIDLSDQGRYNEAIPRAKRVLGTAQKIFGSDHPETVTPLTNLAQLYLNTGAYDRAEPLYQRALAIQEEVYWPDHPKTAVILSDLAGLYNAKGAYDKAEPLLHRALAIQEKAFRPVPHELATSLYNLAALYHSKGDYDEAEPLYQRALGIWEKVVGPNHPDTARALDGLGKFYYHMGAYDKAEPLYQRALTIEEKVNHPNTATSLTNLAELYTKTGAYAKAEPLFLRAVAILEKAVGTDHPDTVSALHGLAQLHYDMGAYDKAEPLYQRTLEIREKTSGLEHRDTAWSLADLAALYVAKGAYDKAEPLYQRALAIQEKVLVPDHPNTAATLTDLAALYDAKGDYDKAEPLYQRALAIEEKALGPNHPHTAAALHNLAVLRWVMGQATAAFPLHARSQAIEAKNLERFVLPGSESRNQAYLQQLRGNTFLSISMSLALPEQRATRLGFTSVLQTKGRVLDAMAEGRRRLRLSMKPEHLALLDELRVVAQQLSNLTHQGTGHLQLEVFRRWREELSLRQEQLETKLESELAKWGAEFREEQIAPVSLAAVQTAVPKDAALVEWYRYQPFDPKTKNRLSRWGPPRYVAYVLKHDGEATVVDVGDADTIEQLIRDFQTGLSNPATTFVKDVAEELSDKLLKPLLPFLRDVERLLISPDGALNLIPFGALLDETGTYLATTRDITYLTIGRDLLRVGALSVGKNDAVVVADPEYGPVASHVGKPEPLLEQVRSIDIDRGGVSFTRLEGTAKEAVALRDLLNMKEENVLTQRQATETRLKQLHGPHILHIATHGFFLNDTELPAAALKQVGFSQDRAPVQLGENPLLRSGLALAGANQRRSGDSDDGILTAAEVAQMDLRGTQLVVLSACQTGVGDVQNGEGVYGLRRALVLAGAETQVTSLWKVADDSTKDLMVDYYQRLLKGEGRSEALRNAQLTMMKSKDRSHPYYWAAFVPIGDWRPLSRNR